MLDLVINLWYYKFADDSCRFYTVKIKAFVDFLTGAFIF